MEGVTFSEIVESQTSERETIEELLILVEFSIMEIPFSSFLGGRGFNFLFDSRLLSEVGAVDYENAIQA